jgi:hypothetical protein
MDGWMDGWMDGCTYACMHAFINFSGCCVEYLFHSRFMKSAFSVALLSETHPNCYVWPCRLFKCVGLTALVKSSA